MEEQQPPAFVERNRPPTPPPPPPPPPPPRTVGDTDLAPAALSYDTFLSSMNETMLAQWKNAVASMKSGDDRVSEFCETIFKLVPRIVHLGSRLSNTEVKFTQALFLYETALASCLLRPFTSSSPTGRSKRPLAASNDDSDITRHVCTIFDRLRRWSDTYATRSSVHPSAIYADEDAKFAFIKQLSDAEPGLPEDIVRLTAHVANSHHLANVPTAREAKVTSIRDAGLSVQGSVLPDLLRRVIVDFQYPCAVRLKLDHSGKYVSVMLTPQDGRDLLDGVARYTGGMIPAREAPDEIDTAMVHRIAMTSQYPTVSVSCKDVIVYNPFSSTLGSLKDESDDGCFIALVESLDIRCYGSERNPSARVYLKRLSPPCGDVVGGGDEYHVVSCGSTGMSLDKHRCVTCMY